MKRPTHAAAPKSAPTAEVPIEGYIFTSSHISMCFTLTCLFLVGYAFWHLGETDILSILGYILIVAAWAIPVGLWCLGRVHGLPLYPVFCTVNMLAFALPLLSHHPIVQLYPPVEHFWAGFMVACALLSGTITWHFLTKKHGQAPAMCLQMDDKGGESILILAMTASLLFNLGKMAGLVILESGIFSLASGIIEGLSMLGIFVLGQRFGSGRLQRKYSSLYFVLLVLISGIQITSLFLVNLFGTTILAMAGYFLGARRIPWVILVVLGLGLAFLHEGKSDIRRDYWSESRYFTVSSLDEFTTLYSKWFNYSWKHLTHQSAFEEESDSDLVDRTSLVHILLYMQDMVNHGHPFLNGDSYSIIPSLLIPRFLNPGKLWSHEGTFRLNIHYGLQSREDTLTTTIGFGLINEGYGNFGLPGCILVGLAAGAFMGWTARWAWGMPVLSFRSLFGVLILGATFQTEFSLGVFVTTIFQGTMALAMFSFFFMKKRPHSGILDWLRTRSDDEQKPAAARPRNSPKARNIPGKPGHPRPRGIS